MHDLHVWTVKESSKYNKTQCNNSGANPSILPVNDLFTIMAIGLLPLSH